MLMLLIKIKRLNGDFKMIRETEVPDVKIDDIEYGVVCDCNGCSIDELEYLIRREIRGEI